MSECLYTPKEIEEELNEKTHMLNVARYIHDEFYDVWRHAEKELEVHPGIIRCRDCAYNFGNENFCEYNPEDIVCTYFETDGLHADDFCSRGKER